MVEILGWYVSMAYWASKPLLQPLSSCLMRLSALPLSKTDHLCKLLHERIKSRALKGYLNVHSIMMKAIAHGSGRPLASGLQGSMLQGLIVLMPGAA